MVTSEEARVQMAAANQARLNLRRSESFLGYLLVAPLVICILVLIIYPLVFAVYISFTDRVVGSEGQFVGLENFVTLVNQPDFRAAAGNTAVMVFAIQTI